MEYINITGLIVLGLQALNWLGQHMFISQDVVLKVLTLN